MESGPNFLAFFALFAGSALVVAKFASHVYGRTKDLAAARAARGRAAPPTAKAPEGTPYRNVAGAPKVATPYTIGSVPAPHEHWGIAYLNGGMPAVRDLAFATGMASGWLTVQDSTHGNLFFHRELTPPDDPVMGDMYNEIASSIDPSTPEGPVTITFDTAIVAAGAAASNHRLRLDSEIANAGLTRAASTCARMQAIVLGVSGFVECVGLVRILRGLELNHRVGFLLAECIIFGALVVVER